MKTYTMAILERDGRDCDPHELIRQIGRMNLLAISGGAWGAIRVYDDPSDPTIPRIIGAWFPCGTNRMVEVTLDVSDTYVVKRVRRVARGTARNSAVVEFEARDIYCDEIGEVVYRASCWK